MAANPSTSNRFDLASNPGTMVSYPVAASTHIYQYTHVMLVGGYLVPAADTSGGVYAGQALQEQNNTGANGALNCLVATPNECPFKTFGFNAGNATATTVGVHVFAIDDNSVVVAGSSTNKVCVGRVTAVLNASSVKVDTTDRFTVASAA